MHDLLEHWRSYELQGPLYLHPKDRAHFELYDNKQVLRRPFTYQELVQSKNFQEDMSGLQFSVFPGPFLGDILNADIFILLLNPGFAPSSLYAQERCKEFRKANCKTLKQDFRNCDFPFFVLNPDLCWTGGYMWWEKKLRSVAFAHSDEMGISYFDSMQQISRRIAAIELYPYASSSFVGSKANKKLPSRLLAKTFVDDILVPRCQNGDCEIIVTRQVKTWDLPPGNAYDTNKPVLYTAGQARSASLSAGSTGGKAILRRLRTPRA